MDERRAAHRLWIPSAVVPWAYMESANMPKMPVRGSANIPAANSNSRLRHRMDSGMVITQILTHGDRPSIFCYHSGDAPVMTGSVAMHVVLFGSISRVRRVGVVVDPAVGDRNRHHRPCLNLMRNLPFRSDA